MTARTNETSPPLSFDDVYRSARPWLVRVALLLVGSQALAEELVQDAFIVLYQRFDEIQNPEGFLRRVLVRSCSATTTRRRVEQERISRMDVPPLLDAPELDELWDALGHLHPDRRAVVVLRFYADLSHEAIADLVGCPAATVRTRLHRALAELRHEVQR